MGKVLDVVTAVAVGAQILILSARSPAVAISADLAKKCREMAIKAHPRAPAGTTPYAQAERAFFNECISKKGEMQKSGSQGDPSADPH